MLVAYLSADPTLHVPAMIKVWYEGRQADVAEFLIVYMSVIVKPRHEVYRPVAELLSSVDCALTHEETLRDPGMMHGRAVLRVYHINGPAAVQPLSGPATPGFPVSATEGCRVA